MAEVPTPVWESTAIEVKRVEGATISDFASEAIDAGALVYHPNNSGFAETRANTRAEGVLLYDAVSGERAVVLQKGLVRARWDGAGSPAWGSQLQASALYSGYWTLVSGGTFTSGYAVGEYADDGTPAPGAGASGTLLIIKLW